MTASKPSTVNEGRKATNREVQRKLRQQLKETHADMRFYLLKETKNKLAELAKRSNMKQTDVIERLINEAFERGEFEETK